MCRPRRFGNSICTPATRCQDRSRPPKEGERYFALIKVEAVNFEAPDHAREKLFFENLTPLYPQTAITARDGAGQPLRPRDGSMTPIGKRPARSPSSRRRATGKTMLLQNIAQSITTNHPEVFLIVLLIDERPRK